MSLQADPFSTIEAEIAAHSAIAQIRRLHIAHPLNHPINTGRGYWLDMSLTGREGNPKVQYRERWKPHRYEPIGSIFMLHGGEPIHGISEGHEGTSVICNIRRNAMAHWIEDEPHDWTDPQVAAALDIADGNIRTLMLRLAAELRSPGFASEFMVELISGQVAIELQRYRMRIDTKPRTGGLSPWQLRLIDNRLSDAGSQISLEELARLCQISVRHLARAFRTSKGCSIGKYVASQRMEQAKRLLLEGDSIKSIAPKVGFSSVASFTNAFRLATGVSPAAFRNSLR